jgi:hypothetical protein
MTAPNLRWTAPFSLAAIACAAALGGCASSVSVGSFKGEERGVAQTVANLQSDTSAQDQAKVCGLDLARALVQRLNLAPGGCQRVIKDQQAEIDPGLEVKVEAVHLGGSAAAPTATATVRSTFEGKHHISTLLLVKESGKWRVSGLQ